MKRMLKIAIVYDWIDSWGGVERVLLTLHEMFPEAIFYTSYYDEGKTPWAKNLTIRTSLIQKLPKFIKNNRVLSVPFYPFAFESFDLSKFDLVISVSSSFAKGIITRPETKHICYLLTPTRFLWLYNSLYTTFKVVNIAEKVQSHLKKWDMVASQRPDQIISISKTVQKRTREIYHRDSEVMYPPFDIDYWQKVKSEMTNSKFKTNLKFFLVVSRLEPYKKVDLVVRAFNETPGENLIIIGRGSKLKRLRSIAKPNISFIQDLSDEELGQFYINARALIMPQEEDFGLVSLEAQFFGCPVISYKKGGAVETVVDRKTGLFFDEQSVPSIQNALAKYSQIEYTLKQSTKSSGLKNVDKFAKTRFFTDFHKFIDFPS